MKKRRTRRELFLEKMDGLIPWKAHLMRMNDNANLHEIHQLLDRAQRDLAVLLEIRGTTTSLRMLELPDSFRRRDLASKLVSAGTWPTHAPAFEAIEQWVHVHWNAERPTRPPAGTVLIDKHPAPQQESRLDDATASRKLVVAAALHGTEAAATHAADFASHGMAEVCSIQLLRGPAVHKSQSLDAYCSLLPYREALRRANSSFHDGFAPQPLPERLDGICALEYTRFVRPAPNPTFDDEWFGSPLIQDGPETLALIIGLVWGTGLRPVRSWHATPADVEAVLPFHLLSGGGGSTHPVDLPPQGFPHLSKRRPLPTEELSDLVDNLHKLPTQSRRRLEIALRRMRNASEKLDDEDRVIDLCIALEALFMEDCEWNNQRKIIARRGSWHFADSVQERQTVRDALKEFYELRSRIVHGNPGVPQTPDESRHRSTLIADVLDIARASLKTMITAGRPQDWTPSTDHRSIRHGPPRGESQILSVKSDSLSWTVQEQKEIDRALESVWRPTVDRAPTLPPGTPCTIHHGIRAENIQGYRRQGKHVVVRHPALLYMAHPKWPKAASDPLDERTAFYCEKDVERHMLWWQEAASEKRLDQFEIPCDSSAFHPKYRDRWPQPLH